MFYVTNTRTKFSGAMNTNEWIKTDFIGCFETLEEAQEAVTKFMDKAKAYVQKLLSMQKEINGGVTVG